MLDIFLFNFDGESGNFLSDFCDHDCGGWNQSECLQCHFVVFDTKDFTWERCHHAESCYSSLVTLLELHKQPNRCKLFVFVECFSQRGSVWQSDLNSRLLVVFWRWCNGGCWWCRLWLWQIYRRLASGFSSTRLFICFDESSNSVSGRFLFCLFALTFLDLKKMLSAGVSSEFINLRFSSFLLLLISGELRSCLSPT